MLNLHESELAGKFVHTGGRAVTALQTAHTEDPSPVVRKRQAGSRRRNHLPADRPTLAQVTEQPLIGHP